MQNERSERDEASEIQKLPSNETEASSGTQPAFEAYLKRFQPVQPILDRTAILSQMQASRVEAAAGASTTSSLARRALAPTADRRPRRWGAWAALATAWLLGAGMGAIATTLWKPPNGQAVAARPTDQPAGLPIAGAPSAASVAGPTQPPSAVSATADDIPSIGNPADPQTAAGQSPSATAAEQKSAERLLQHVFHSADVSDAGSWRKLVALNFAGFSANQQSPPKSSGQMPLQSSSADERNWQQFTLPPAAAATRQRLWEELLSDRPEGLL